MASSSSYSAVDAISPQEKYDVFLSFRGEDTRNTFTSHLCAALRGKKIQTFIDDRLERGEEIAPALLEAIEESKLSVIIFSKKYASSTWCLDELVHILKCKQRDGQFVVPIFYDIDPSDVRKQQGSYADAFAKHEERFKDSNMDKVLKWRAAVTKAANLSGFDNSNKTGKEADLVDKVVQTILEKLNCKWSSDLTGLVGIESKIEQIESLLCIDSTGVFSVGLWGMGGIGKTTLADAVFYRLSSKFEASCFLANVREESEKHGVKHLRNELIRKILNDKDVTINTQSIGSDLVKQRLQRTKVLIVLDDVSDPSQLELLHGDDVHFCSGSRIIITTRDRQLLHPKVGGDKVYEVKGLQDDEALQLFCLHAFQNKSLPTDNPDFSRQVVDYVKGIPLALKVLGRSFLPCNTDQDWEEKLQKLKTFPDEKIQNVLRLSYNGLERNEQEIFLDIACFYRGMDMDSAKRMVDIQGFCPDGIRDLIDKSLISVSKKNCLEMHDLLQEMGRRIVREQCPQEPGKRSRLWVAKDVHHVLQNNTGTEMVQCISLDKYMIPRGSIQFRGATYEKMYNLRYLEILRQQFIFSDTMFEKFSENFETFRNLYLTQGLESLPNSLRYLHWVEYPFTSLPSKFSPENLIELRMPNSRVKAKLWNGGQILENLEVLDLSFCRRLTKVPDISESRKLRHINFSCCDGLIRIPSYFKDFNRLAYLNLRECTNLKFFSEMPDSIEFLDLSRTAIQKLPTSSVGLFCPNTMRVNSHLHTLDLSGCRRLTSLPHYIFNLTSLKSLDLERCSKIGHFPEIMEPVEHLKSLSLSWTAVKELPSSFVYLIGLQQLELSGCRRLKNLPDYMFKLTSLKSLDLSCCNEICEHFPEIMEPMEHLKSLSLSGTSIEELPSSFVNLIGLQQLKLRGCIRLKSLPDYIFKLTSLESLDLSGCSEFEHFPEIMEPVEHLKSLDVSNTAVKALPSSFGIDIHLQHINRRPRFGVRLTCCNLLACAIILIVCSCKESIC